MIISASYKTDIPAFYGEWLLNRVQTGFCRMVNPYNRKQVVRVPLGRDDVDAFVFWTRNVRPFFGGLETLRGLGYPFTVQFTITGYPAELETSVIPPRRTVDDFRKLAEIYGPRVAVWRYDPILLSSLTDLDFHRRNFETLSRSLAGATDEVVVSWTQFYRKTQRNLAAASTSGDFTAADPDDEAKRSLLAEFQAIAADRGMALTICSQPGLLVEGAGEARCIDSTRLRDVAGHDVTPRGKAPRPTCRCLPSRDIGEYDTCPHGCVYCYAVASPPKAAERYRRHDPAAEFLFTPR